jgi:exopolysaccharide biosynthesis protein
MVSLFIGVGILAPGAASVDIAYAGRAIGGVWYHAVIANLASENVRASGVVNSQIGRSESLWTMIARSKPTVAVSGTFFDVKSARPIGDIVIEGTGVVNGYHGSCLAVDYFNKASILDPTWGRRFDASSYRLLIRGGVRLVTGGKVTVYPRSQKFRDPRVWSKARRVAVGVTGSEKLVILATNSNVHLSTLAAAMKAFGARNAIALDGGSSAALYYRGKLLVAPQRRLTNILTLVEAPGVAWASLPITAKK